jgi:peroxiredoxin
METGTSHTGPLDAGNKLVDFELRAVDGKTYSSKAARGQGLLLAVLFKVGCGTCQYTLPFLERFYQQYALPSSGKFQVWGISQDTAEDTLTCARENGNVTLPLLLDSDLQVSVHYGPTNVPDLYLLGAGDTIQSAVLGHFGKDEFNALAQQIAAFVGVPYVPIVRDEDDAPAIKPG